MKAGKIGKISGVVAFVFSSLGALSEEGWSKTITIQPKQPIVIAAFDAPLIGLDHKNAVRLAAQHHGPLFGHDIEILTVPEKFGCNGVPIYHMFPRVAHDPRVVGLIGPTCSFDIWPLFAAINSPRLTLDEFEVLVISPSNTFPWLTLDPFLSDFYYRVAPSDAGQGTRAAEFALTQLKATKALLILDITADDGSETDHGVPPLIEFFSTFTGGGGELVLFEFSPVDGDFSAILDAVDHEIAQCAGKSSCDFMVYITEFSAPEFVPLYQQLKARSTNVPIMSTDTIVNGFDPELLEPGNDPKIYVTLDDLTGPHFSAFVTAYENAFGRAPSPYEARAYDATNLLLMALEQTGQVGDRGEVRFDQDLMLDAMNALNHPPHCGAGGIYHPPVNGDMNLNAFDVAVPVLSAEADLQFERIFLNPNDSCAP